jgi:hypothetical protein
MNLPPVEEYLKAWDIWKKKGSFKVVCPSIVRNNN